MKTPVAQLWQYPLSRPSWRFTYFNNFVRSLDVRFAALPSVTQRSWDMYGNSFPWAKWCLEWIYDFELDRPEILGGVAAYRNVNCNQLSQGLPVLDVPPLVATAPDNDSISIFGSDPLFVTWGGRAEEPSGVFVASVRECSLNHAPESGPRASRMRFSFTAPIEYGVPFSVLPCFENRPGADRLPAMAIGISISDSAGVPFGAGRAVFTRPYL